MAMYRYFQTEEDGPWQPITDSPTALEDAKRQGAKKMTILAVDSPLGADDAKRGHKYVGPLYFDVDCADVADAIKSAQQLVSSDGIGRQVNQCFAAINDLGNIFVCHKNYLSFYPILIV